MTIECDSAKRLPSRVEDESAENVQCCGSPPTGEGHLGRKGEGAGVLGAHRRSSLAILIFILLVSCVVDIGASDSEHKNQNCKYQAICC